MTKRGVFTSLVAAIALAGGAYWWANKKPAPPAAPPKEATAKASSNEIRYPVNAPQLAYLQVSAAAAFPEPLLEPLNGRVTYDENQTTRIAAPIAGRVIKIGAQPGDAVSAGQPLIWLDAPEFASAMADVSKAQADVRLKQSAYQRSKTLFEGDVLARKDFESAQADLNASEAESRRAQQRMANLTQGKSLDGDKYVLRSPIGGVVAERKVNPGSEVRPDATDPLFVITDPRHLWIIIDVPEKYLGRVAVGQKITVDVDAYPGSEFLGRIASIGEVLDPQTRRVQVRCTIENPQRRLKPEMFARVTPIVDDNRKLVRLPNGSIITEGLYPHVFVEKEPGVFAKRRVVPGLQGREETYIKEGLIEGERVVTKGTLLLNSELAVHD